MNRGNIRDAIRRQTLNNASDISDADLNDVIDEAYYVVSQAADWPWLETSTNVSVTANTVEYALPADFARLQGIVRSGKQKRLSQISFEYYLDRYGNNPPTSTEGVWFYIRGDNFGIVPVPSANEANAYILYYFKTPTLMAADTDQPEWTPAFHHILVDYGVYRVFYREEYFQEAETAFQHFMAGLGQMMSFYNRRNNQNYPLVVGDGVQRRAVWDDRLRVPGFVV